MRLRYAVAALSLALLTSSAAQATTLWDQSTINTAGPGIFACQATGFQGFTAHSVQDVTVPASGWVVTKITQWYAGFDPGWIGGISSGYINVFPKTGPLPTDVPSAVLVSTGWSCIQDNAKTAQLNQSVLAVSVNVNLNLPPGNYWIGITPRRSLSPFGVNSMWASDQVGDPVATHMAPNPWANTYGSWDGVFLIEGEIPVPTESATWGSMKALYR